MVPNAFDPEMHPLEGPSLRVSVAALVRLLFKNPEDGRLMLVLERTATLKEDHDIVVKVKPFGGGLRILNPLKMNRLIGEFHYDSLRSQQERDFRIKIRPTQWEAVQQVCTGHLNTENEGIIETSPVRELTEEIYDSLHIKIFPEDYSLSSLGMLIEDRSIATENIHAPGIPTKRIYYLYEAKLTNPRMGEMIIGNHKQYPDRELERMALKNARLGGKGRANAVFTVPLAELTEFYQSVPEKTRDGIQYFQGHQLDGNIPAILDL